MPDGVVMGFDFGLCRTGVAVGQRLTGTASALQVVNTPFKKGWQPLLELIEQWQPSDLVVGHPLRLHGAESDITLAARRFANRLADRSGLPVHQIDERLTSQAAEAQYRELRQSGAARKKDASRLDAHAARLIVETWLQTHPENV
jgi:putative Holliday junction resolvase